MRVVEKWQIKDYRVLVDGLYKRRSMPIYTTYEVRLRKESFLRFFSRYEEELNIIAMLLEIRQEQLCLVYMIQNRLPTEAMRMQTRIKPYDSAICILRE